MAHVPNPRMRAEQLPWIAAPGYEAVAATDDLARHRAGTTARPPRRPQQPLQLSRQSDFTPFPHRTVPLVIFTAVLLGLIGVLEYTLHVLPQISNSAEAAATQNATLSRRQYGNPLDIVDSMVGATLGTSGIPTATLIDDVNSLLGDSSGTGAGPTPTPHTQHHHARHKPEARTAMATTWDGITFYSVSQTSSVQNGAYSLATVTEEDGAVFTGWRVMMAPEAMSENAYVDASATTVIKHDQPSATTLEGFTYFSTSPTDGSYILITVTKEGGDVFTAWGASTSVGVGAMSANAYADPSATTVTKHHQPSATTWEGTTYYSASPTDGAYFLTTLTRENGAALTAWETLPSPIEAATSPSAYVNPDATTVTKHHPPGASAFKGSSRTHETTRPPAATNTKPVEAAIVTWNGQIIYSLSPTGGAYRLTTVTAKNGARFTGWGKEVSDSTTRSTDTHTGTTTEHRTSTTATTVTEHHKPTATTVTEHQKPTSTISPTSSPEPKSTHEHSSAPSPSTGSFTPHPKGGAHTTTEHPRPLTPVVSSKTSSERKAGDHSSTSVSHAVHTSTHLEDGAKSKLHNPTQGSVTFSAAHTSRHLHDGPETVTLSHGKASATASSTNRNDSGVSIATKAHGEHSSGSLLPAHHPTSKIRHLGVANTTTNTRTGNPSLSIPLSSTEARSESTDDGQTSTQQQPTTSTRHAAARTSSASSSGPSVTKSFNQTIMASPNPLTLIQDTQNYFYGIYLPVLGAVLLRLFAGYFYRCAQLVSPFFQLSRPRGASLHELSRANHIGSQFLLEPFPSARSGDATLLCATLLYATTQLLMPIASEMISVHYSTYAFDVDDSTVIISGAALWVAPVVVRIMQALLGCIVVLLITTWILLRRNRCAIASNPASIATIASLVNHPYTIRALGYGVGRPGRSALAKTFAAQRFHLGPYMALDGSRHYGIIPSWPHPAELQGTDVPARTTDSSLCVDRPSGRYRQGGVPKMMFVYLTVLTAVVLVLLGIVVAYYLNHAPIPFESFMDSQSFGPRFILTLLGMILQFPLLSLTVSNITSLPYTRLAARPRRPQLDIVDPVPLTSQGAILYALRRREWFSASLAVAAGVLVELLLLLLPGVPFSPAELWVAAEVSWFGCMGCLGLILLVALVSWLQLYRARRVARWPREPVTLTAVGMYVAGTRMAACCAANGTLLDDGRCYEFGSRDGRWVLDAAVEHEPKSPSDRTRLLMSPRD